MPLCLATISYGRKEGRSDLPATAPRISRPHRHTAVLPMDRQGKIRFSLPPSARGSSIEQLLADGLTKGKGADIFPLVSRGHRSDRIPPRESPRGAHGTLQPVWMKVS